MYFQIERSAFYLRFLTIFITILECRSVNHPFCNDLNQISNAYSFGQSLFITQEMTTIWKFDTKDLQFSKEKQSVGSIFGTDTFEKVDTAFWFDFGLCIRKAVTPCANMNKARNVVVVIGEMIKAADSAKTYGYIAFRLKADDTLEELPKSFNVWGLSSRGTFIGKFWPTFKRKGSLIIGSAFNRKQKTLYLLVTEFDENRNPLNRIYTRDLDDRKGWSEWTIFGAERLKGMFAIKNNVYVVDIHSNIKRYQMKKNGLIDKKTISSAKEFFNCMENSSLLAQMDRPGLRVKDFIEYNTPDLNPYNDPKEEIETTYSDTTPTVVTGETIITGVENLTTKSKASVTQTVTTQTLTTQTLLVETTSKLSGDKSDDSVSGWLICLTVVLIIALILFIVLIATLMQIKYKNKDKKQSKSGSLSPKVKPSPKGASGAPSLKTKSSLESVKSVRSDL